MPLKLVITSILVFLFATNFSQVKTLVSNDSVSQLTNSLSSEFYKNRYEETDLLKKITDNYGNNFTSLYGTRNLRPVLHGVAYRGGGNNYFHSSNKRANQNPLPDDGLINLCKEGFSKSVYLYQKNFESAFTNVTCNCVDGEKNKVDYLQLDYFEKDHIYKMIEMVYESATNDSIGPVYLHCWNGWHASGYISAILLKQFCGYTSIQATNYWDIATDGANQSPRYRTIRKQINDFVPIEKFKINDELGNSICPPMPKVIDKSKIHLEIQHLVVVPEAIPINYKLILYEVKFAPGKTTIASPESNKDLNYLIEALTKYSDLKVEIGGHTDRSGNEANNKVLSTKRAKFVYDFLLQKGINSSQVSFKGFGSSRPAYSNKYKSGRNANRRIEVKILQKKDYGSNSLVQESAYESNLLFIKNIDPIKIKTGEKYILNNLLFAPNSILVSDSSNQDLIILEKFLLSSPKTKIEIGGYTDNSGIKEKNDTLSQQRAKAVYDFLIFKGIKDEQISHKGYGDTNPIASNRQKWGRDKNRRIEIKILTK